MKKLIRFFKDGRFEEILGCLAIIIVIIPVIINIINRSILNFYSTNLEVIALFAYVWIGYGFFGFMYKRDAHVDMKFVVNMMSGRIRFAFDLLRDVLIFLISAYLCYWGVKLCSTNLHRYASGTRIPMAIGYASIAFGFFSGTIRSFCAIVARFSKKDKEEPAE